MPVEFIAEVSSNHSQDLSRCLKFVDVSADIGCSAVKFQLFKIDQLFIPEVVADRPEIQQRKEWELPVSYLPHIQERCKEKGLKFTCTPFYLEAVQELQPYVDFYKIASYELLWNDLLKECAKTGKPVVLSTGMATIDEVAGAVEMLHNNGCNDLTLLHCVSGYPTPVEECNLTAIEEMRKVFKLKVGWSDHSVQPAVIYRAVHHWDAAMIEFHLDLEGKGEEFGGGHCWLPKQIEEVINNINKGFNADGTGEKGPTKVEARERGWRADPSDGLRPLVATRQRWWE